MDEERDQQLSQLRADMTERLALNRQRLEEEHANLLEVQAQVRHTAMHTVKSGMSLYSANTSDRGHDQALLLLTSLLDILPCYLAYPFAC